MEGSNAESRKIEKEAIEEKAEEQAEGQEEQADEGGKVESAFIVR
jgi:hypothetical protein